MVTGTVLPPFEAEVTDDPAVGMTLPTVQGTDVAGAPMTIGPDGRAKAVLLLAHWCPHCQAEVPRLVAWLAENPVPDGVDIVAVSTAADPTRTNYPASAWLEREGWPVPTLNDDATLAAYRALGGPTFPGFVFVTADGVVQSRTTGEISVGRIRRQAGADRALAGRQRGGERRSADGQLFTNPVVSTTSKSDPRSCLSWFSSLSFQRASETPEKNHGDPLSARMIP